MTRSVDVARFIDERRVGGFQLLVLLLCFIIMTIDGFDAQAVGFVAPVILSQPKNTASDERRQHGETGDGDNDNGEDDDVGKTV